MNPENQICHLSVALSVYGFPCLPSKVTVMCKTSVLVILVLLELKHSLIPQYFKEKTIYQLIFSPIEEKILMKC